MNKEWSKPIIFSVGVLTEIGFHDDWNYLLVVSYQGRSVIDCDNMTKVARDNTQLNTDDFNESKRTIKGIGPIKNKNIHCVGLWGGNIAQSTQDGWQVTVKKDDVVIFTSPNGDVSQLTKPLTELRAVGFSHNGKLMIYATSSEIVCYVRSDEQKKVIMSHLPQLEKPYNSPRQKDDNYMYDVILLACQWGRPHWLNLALNWFDEGFKIDRAIINALEKLLNSENLPQSYKHRVYATVKKWKMENYTYIDVK